MPISKNEAVDSPSEYAQAPNTFVELLDLSNFKRRPYIVLQAVNYINN